MIVYDTIFYNDFGSPEQFAILKYTTVDEGDTFAVCAKDGLILGEVEVKVLKVPAQKNSPSYYVNKWMFPLYCAKPGQPSYVAHVTQKGRVTTKAEWPLLNPSKYETGRMLMSIALASE